MRFVPSPNFDNRAEDATPRYVILHYTGMHTAAMALRRLCDPAAKVSAHYLIDRDGATTQLVDDGKRAWHAGVSCWENCQDINSASIGIELVNRGHQLGYQDFPERQIAALITLLQNVCARHAIPAHNILGHSDVAPMRKDDPGEYFPWEKMAQRGFGFWPAIMPATGGDATPQWLRAQLRQIGYALPSMGDYDRELRQTLLAFQRHWHPTELSGLATAETARRIEAVSAGLTTVRQRPPAAPSGTVSAQP